MRGRGKLAGILATALVAGPAPAQQVAEAINPPPHTAPFPTLGTGYNDRQI